MAFQMNHTVKGFNYPESYWKAAQRNFNDVTKTGQVTFNGYANAAARKADVNGNVIDQKVYDVTKEQYEEFFSEAITIGAVYEMAAAKLEGNAPAEGEEDKRVSFFDGATEV